MMLMDIMAQQYALVRTTRESLFAYLESIPHQHYVELLDGFGGTSIRNLHVHVADCYGFWLGRQALKLAHLITPPEDATVPATRSLFQQVDHLVEDFIGSYSGRWDESVPVSVPPHGDSMTTTPLWLLTHTMTHEFHHKGQIVSMTRHLGHIPPDTDLVL